PRLECDPPRLRYAASPSSSMPKSNLTDTGRKTVIDELLKFSNNEEVPRGAFAKVGVLMSRHPDT
ncbi:hypothetical protein L917_14795, partial [Phytophthora nicotianae]